MVARVVTLACLTAALTDCRTASGPHTSMRDRSSPPPTCQSAEVASVEDARVALDRFLAAAERRDFGVVYGLLAQELRARYTPERLARDFDAEPLAKDRLERAHLALSHPATVDGQGVHYLLGEGRAISLVREADGFHVAALE